MKSESLLSNTFYLASIASDSPHVTIKVRENWWSCDKMHFRFHFESEKKEVQAWLCKCKSVRICKDMNSEIMRRDSKRTPYPPLLFFDCKIPFHFQIGFNLRLILSENTIYIISKQVSSNNKRWQSNFSLSLIKLIQFINHCWQFVV